MDARIVTIVPVYNEERTVRATIQSLVGQSHPPTKIIVVANNCSDQTVEIVRLEQEILPQLELIVMEHNPDKKAGALNKAFFTLNPKEWDYVLQMDGDTILNNKLIEEALKEFEQNSNLGGVCSRCLVAPLEEGNWLNKLLWRLQNIEYSLWDSLTVMREGSVKVLAGAITIYRMEVLQNVAILRTFLNKNRPTLWQTNHLVEDYILTLDVRELGYDGYAGMGMFAYTQVPLTIKALHRQRDRWYTGTLQYLQERGWCKATRRDIVALGLRLGIMLFTFVYIGAFCFFLTMVPLTSLRLHPIALVILGVALLDVIVRIKYLRHPDWVQRFILLTILPWQLYALWDEYLTVRSIFLSFRKDRKW